MYEFQALYRGSSRGREAHHHEKLVRKRRETIDGDRRRSGVLCDCDCTRTTSARPPFTLARRSETHHRRRATRRLANPALPRLVARSRGRRGAASAADRARHRPSCRREPACEGDGEKSRSNWRVLHQRVATHPRSVRPILNLRLSASLSLAAATYYVIRRESSSRF